jgi:hypothetical protein
MREVFYFLVLLLFCASAAGQEVKLDDKKWAEISDKLDYSEASDKEPVSEELPETVVEKRKPDLLPKWNMAPIRVLAIILVIGILVTLIIYLLDKDLFKRRKQRTRIKVNIENPDYLDLSDLERALNEEGELLNYKACIRIYYLLLLEKYDSLRMIYWKKDKTNRQYVIEIRKHEVKNDLKMLTRVYEDVWFGEFLLNKQQYEHWSQQFESIIKKSTQ